MSGEEQAGQQGPARGAQQLPGDAGEQPRHSGVQRHVGQVVAEGLQAAQRIVEAEGERAERPEGLVAAAVRQERAPEVVVEDVEPRRLGEQVLVGLDRSAVGQKRKGGVGCGERRGWGWGGEKKKTGVTS